MEKRLPIVHGDALPWSEVSHGNFRHRRKAFGTEAGNVRLGCSLYEVPPGTSAWPYHFHCGNEEALYLLAGQGMLRLGGERITLRSGDYVALPVGAEWSHQLLNTSSETLRYMCFSTMADPDVAVYPDPDKIGVAAGPRAKRTLALVFKRRSKTDYFDGEPDA